MPVHHLGQNVHNLTAGWPAHLSKKGHLKTQTQGIKHDASAPSGTVTKIIKEEGGCLSTSRKCLTKVRGIQNQCRFSRNHVNSVKQPPSMLKMFGGAKKFIQILERQNGSHSTLLFYHLSKLSSLMLPGLRLSVMASGPMGPPSQQRRKKKPRLLMISQSKIPQGKINSQTLKIIKSSVNILMMRTLE